MEFSLHRQLKEMYAGDDADTEVRRGQYRVDVVRGSELIEIQHSGLASIRRKVEQMLAKNRVRVVKPLVTAKKLIKRNKAGGPVVDQRWSPKRQTLVHAFEELVSFAKLLPQRRLVVEIVPVTVEEWRRPGHGRRRRHRMGDFIIEDRLLLECGDPVEIRTPRDLLKLLPEFPETDFGTAELATTCDIPRWLAQRAAYCLRESGVVRIVGKAGNAQIYRLSRRPRKRAAA